MDYPLTMTKTRQEMSDLELPWGGGEATVVSDRITSTGRWSTISELIFRLPGMPDDLAYRTIYSQGATEQQDEAPWEHAAAVCSLVRAVPVTRIEWQKVEPSTTPTAPE